jgi:hypothetical protein
MIGEALWSGVTAVTPGFIVRFTTAADIQCLVIRGRVRQRFLARMLLVAAITKWWCLTETTLADVNRFTSLHVLLVRLPAGVHAHDCRLLDVSSYAIIGVKQLIQPALVYLLKIQHNQVPAKQKAETFEQIIQNN